MGFNPSIDVFAIEPNELAYFEERHAALGDQTTDESLRHAESFSEAGYVDQSVLRCVKSLRLLSHTQPVGREISEMGQPVQEGHAGKY